MMEGSHLQRLLKISFSRTQAAKAVPLFKNNKAGSAKRGL